MPGLNGLDRVPDRAVDGGKVPTGGATRGTGENQRASIEMYDRSLAPA
jgi:hypothetical protein